MVGRRVHIYYEKIKKTLTKHNINDKIIKKTRENSNHAHDRYSSIQHSNFIILCLKRYYLVSNQYWLSLDKEYMAT